MKIKYRKAATITLDNGHDIDVDYLGKGMFCTAWLTGDIVYLLVRPKREGTDYSKDILIEARRDLDWVDEKAKYKGKWHLPELDEVGFLDKDDTRVFRSPYYSSLRASHKDAYAQFKILNRTYDEVWQKVMMPDMQGRRSATGYDFNWHFLSEVEDQIDRSLYEALRAVAEASENYGSGYVFELNKQNVGVNGFGTLILRDVLFDLEILDKVRRNAIERSRRRY